MKIRLLFLIIMNIPVIIAAENLIINRVEYESVVIDYAYPVLVTVYLQSIDVDKVSVLFNGVEINKVYTNFNSMIKDDVHFKPSFYFEITQFRSNNQVQFFLILSQGITVSDQFSLPFDKARIIQKEQEVLSAGEYFFVKAGENSDFLFYDIEVETDGFVRRIGQIIFENNIYFKMKAVKPGSFRLEVLKFDESNPENNRQLLSSYRLNIQQ